MATFLFDEIIFGPVKSRRLGVSLGINLLPTGSKLCNFNCIYCECGWSGKGEGVEDRLPSQDEVKEALENKLISMKKNGAKPDVITFAGNGEPTLHPSFPGIIDDTIALRNKYFPTARIAVLSNSTTANKPETKEALLKVDSNILKLDSAIDSTLKLLNQPHSAINAESIIKELVSFNGRLILQTLFVRGTYMGRVVDNTTDEEINAWLAAISRIRPEEVMIYTISRDIPEGSTLEKISLSVLNRIAEHVRDIGFRTQVSG